MARFKKHYNLDLFHEVKYDTYEYGVFLEWIYPNYREYIFILKPEVEDNHTNHPPTPSSKQETNLWCNKGTIQLFAGRLATGRFSGSPLGPAHVGSLQATLSAAVKVDFLK